jgi:uncharacterized protein YndB with AHSA1/START domain
MRVAKKRPPEPIVEALAIAVPPERAWEALTSPRVLGDLVMGHVEMDTKPGRRFSWHWGVWEAAAPGKSDARAFTWRGTVLDAVPGSTLVLGGAGESTVVFTVKGGSGASLVTVVQGDVPRGFDLEEYRYGWADFLLRLKTHLERPPYSDTVFLRTLVRGTPAQILSAWLSPAAMSKLLPGRARMQARTGGRFEWQLKAPQETKFTGAFLEIAKPRRVAFTFEAGGKPCEVRLSAERTPYGTLVSLEQLGTANVAGRHEHPEGSGRRFWAHLLERLRVYFFYGRKIRAA